MTTSANQLRQLWEKKLIIAPGVFDGLSTRLVEQAGFEAIYASGGAIARSSGLPDLGLLYVDEILERLRQITGVTSLPVIADADNGYGNALNVYRSVKSFAQTGIAALHLEDQQLPKRCGHLDDKKLVSIKEMQQKIKAARDAVPFEDLVLIARTDAIAVEGFEAALERAAAYVEAGAEMLFIEAPQTIDQIKQIGERITPPKLLNLFAGGKTPMVPAKEVEAWGYKLIIIPSDLQRSAIFAMQKTLNAILTNGNSESVQEEMVTFKEREKIIRTEEYLKRDQEYHR